MSHQPVYARFVAGNIAVDLHERSTHEYHRSTQFILLGGYTLQDGVHSFALHVRGRTPDEMEDRLNRIAAVLDESRRERLSGRIGGNLYLAFRTSNAVRYHVVDGRLERGTALPTLADIQPVLTLECIPTGYGDAIPIPESEIVVNGDGQLIRIPDVPGTGDALVRLYVQDESTGGQVINRLRMGRVSGHDLIPADFPAVLAFEPTGAGSWGSDDPEEDEPDDYVHLTTTSAWQTFAALTVPGSDLVSPELNLFTRVRSEAPMLPAVSGVSVSSAEAFSLRQQMGAAGIGIESITLSAPSEPGRLLTMVRSGLGVSAASIPSGWTRAVMQSSGFPPDGVEILYMADNPGGITTVSWSGSVRRVHIAEWRGFDGESSPLDETASNGSSGTSHATGATASTAGNNALALAAHRLPATVTSYTAGWATLQSSFSQHLRYRNLTEPTAVSATATTESGGTGWNAVAVFTGSEAEAGSMPVGGYQVVVVPYDVNGDWGVPSEPQAINLSAVGVIDVDWQPLSSGDVAGYLVFWLRGVQAWRYHDAGDTGSFRIYTESGATVATPRQTQSPGLLQVSIGAGLNGQDMRSVSVIDLDRLSGQWQALDIGPLSRPGAVLLDETPEPWRVELAGRHQSGGWSIDTDIAWPLPHNEPQMELVAVNGNGAVMQLDGPALWRFDLRPDGRASAALLDPSTLAVVGNVRRDGRLRLRHGDNWLSIIADIADGVSDLDDARIRVWGLIVPGFPGGLRGEF